MSFRLLSFWLAMFASCAGGVSSGLACQSESISEPATTQEKPAEKRSDYASLLDEIDQFAEKAIEQWSVPGLAMAIVKDGEVLFAKGYGLREIETDQAVDEDTLFCIASNSKAFTAAALGLLVERKQLKWDDPVTKYVPDFRMPDPNVTGEITVRDLVCHRSGLDTFSGDLLWFGTNYTSDEVIQRIPELKPVSSFRSQYGYQNLMFVVAAKVIENVSGKKWDAFVESEFLQPIGMERTTTSITKMKDNFALPHNESGGNGLRALKLRNLDNCWGACGLNSSVNDLAKWMNVLLADGQLGDQQLISRAQLWEMMQPYTVMPISRSAADKTPSRHFQCYGLGFFLSDYHGRKIVHHGGGMDGMISQLAIVPEEKLGVVVLTNSETSVSKYLKDHVLDCFLGAEQRPDYSSLAWKQYQEGKQKEASAIEEENQQRLPDTQPTLPLEQYAAVFRSKLYGDVQVELIDDKLVMSMLPAPEFVADLKHWQYNTFEIQWRDSVMYNFPRGFVTFTIDQDGKPHQLIIDQPNSDFWFYELDLFRVKEDAAK